MIFFAPCISTPYAWGFEVNLMRQLTAYCNRLRRRYGARFAVIPQSRGVYRVFMFCNDLGDWFPVRSCSGVAEAMAYLRSFERVKED